jgi:short-subunit dehydrogenase
LPLAGTYSASKSAALTLAKTLRAKLKSTGTHVVAVMPVQADTKLGGLMPEPKLRPSQVAVEALDAVDSGPEEVFPGELSKMAHQRFKTDPAAVQAMLSQRFHSVA